MNNFVKSILDKYGKDKSRLLDMLLDIQAEYHCIPDEAIGYISKGIKISKVDVVHHIFVSVW